MILSKNQKEILDMILLDYETPKSISKRRGISIQAVYKTIHKLKEKGAFRGGLKQGVENIPPAPLPTSKYYRWHGLQFDIILLEKSDFYYETIKKGNIIVIDRNTIVLYKEKLEIYQAIGGSFNGQTVNDGFSKAMEYFNKLFIKLENRLKIIVLKNGSQNIKLVAGHCAEVENEFTKLENNQAYKKITIYGEDGKAWFKTDNSWQLNEAETIHPQTAKADAHKVFEKFLNDWRTNNPPTNTELNQIFSNQDNKIDKIIELMQYQAQNIALLTEQINAHIPAIIKLGENAEKLGNNTEKMTEVMIQILKNNKAHEQESKKKIYIKGNAQTKLGMFR